MVSRSIKDTRTFRIFRKLRAARQGSGLRRHYLHRGGKAVSAAPNMPSASVPRNAADHAATRAPLLGRASRLSFRRPSGNRRYSCSDCDSAVGNQSSSSNRTRSSRVAHVHLTGLPSRSKHIGVPPDRQKTPLPAKCVCSAYRPCSPAQPAIHTRQSRPPRPSCVPDIALAPSPTAIETACDTLEATAVIQPPIRNSRDRVHSCCVTEMRNPETVFILAALQICVMKRRLSLEKVSLKVA
jgi:hypothetical protein